MLYLKGMGPREAFAQHVGDVVDNLLDRYVGVNELQIEHKTVIMSDRNVMEA